MGIDLWSVPVLLDSEPVQVIRRDAAVWEAASWRAPFSDDFGDHEEPLPEVNRAMLLGRPSGLDALSGPWHSGSRGYERAEYAFDPATFRDGHETRERSLPYRIIHGDRRFADHAVSGQGMTWRCSARAFLIEAADAIEALDEAAVRSEFSIEDMVRSGVYKVRPNDDEDETFARAMDDLRWLARYYRDVASHGYDLIVILD
ncbi:DUF1877 family protein [Spirillospora sp. NPDC049652]